MIKKKNKRKKRKEGKKDEKKEKKMGTSLSTYNHKTIPMRSKWGSIYATSILLSSLMK